MPDSSRFSNSAPSRLPPFLLGAHRLPQLGDNFQESFRRGLVAHVALPCREAYDPFTIDYEGRRMVASANESLKRDAIGGAYDGRRIAEEREDRPSRFIACLSERAYIPYLQAFNPQSNLRRFLGVYHENLCALAFELFDPVAQLREPFSSTGSGVADAEYEKDGPPPAEAAKAELHAQGTDESKIGRFHIQTHAIKPFEIV
jgi:hypothetical protein